MTSSAVRALERRPRACARPPRAAARCAGRRSSRRRRRRRRRARPASPRSRRAVGRVDPEQLARPAGTARDAASARSTSSPLTIDVEGVERDVRDDLLRHPAHRHGDEGGRDAALAQLGQQFARAGTPRHAVGRRAAAARGRSATARSRRRQVDAARPAGSRRSSTGPARRAASPSSWVQVPPKEPTSSLSDAIQYGSVSTRVPSMSQRTAAGRRSDGVREVTRSQVYPVSRGPILEGWRPTGRRERTRYTHCDDRARTSSAAASWSWRSKAGTTPARRRAAP